MKLPYSKLDLQIALLTAITKLEKYEEEKNNIENILNNEFPGLNTPAQVNKATAEHFGISLTDLINSPNYEKLTDEYKTYVSHKIIDILKDKVKLTDKEARAIILFGLDLL